MNPIMLNIPSFESCSELRDHIPNGPEAILNCRTAIHGRADVIICSQIRFTDLEIGFPPKAPKMPSSGLYFGKNTPGLVPDYNFISNGTQKGRFVQEITHVFVSDK